MNRWPSPEKNGTIGDGWKRLRPPSIHRLYRLDGSIKNIDRTHVPVQPRT